MHSMNGKAIWCKPARTKEYDFSKVEESSDEEISILAEAAKLVADGIRAGLIKPSKQSLSASLDERGRLSVTATCKKCRGPFSRHRKSDVAICFPCRLGPVNCKACGVLFRRNRSNQVVCSNECKYKHTVKLTQPSKARQQRTNLDCPICGNKYSMRTSGGKVSKTCGKECGKILVSQLMKGRKRK